jgi:hypothetical protein
MFFICSNRVLSQWGGPGGPAGNPAESVESAGLGPWEKICHHHVPEQQDRTKPDMRTFEIIVALVVAAVLFIVLKLIGLVIQFALIAAVIGFVGGLLIARSFRSKSG